MLQTDKFIIDYLSGKDWTSPTNIGNAYRKGYHSAWASPKCKKLTKDGILERNEKGWYKLKHSDNSDWRKYEHSKQIK